MHLKGVFSVVFTGQVIDEFQNEHSQDATGESVVQDMEKEWLGH